MRNTLVDVNSIFSLSRIIQFLRYARCRVSVVITIHHAGQTGRLGHTGTHVTVTELFPMEDLPDEFLAKVKYLQERGYRERRHILWRSQKPRLRRYLYKFRAFDDARSIERVRDILIQNRLRLSPPGELNDPFDMALKVTVDGTPTEISRRLAPLLKKQVPNWEARKRETRRLLNNLDELELKAQNTFSATISAAGVCSFGGDPRSILAWSHYASEHRGVCLQFETARDVGTFGLALPVNYSAEYPVFNWVKERENILRVLLRKYEGWKYEDELRIVMPEQARQFIKFRPISLSGVIIGCSATEESVDRLNEVIAERRSLSLPVPKLYRVLTHKSKFRLIIKKEKLKV